MANQPRQTRENKSRGKMLLRRSSGRVWGQKPGQLSKYII